MPTPYKRRPWGGRRLAGGAAPLDATVSVSVGTFTKPTGAAPVSQAISSLGFTPKAIIFWTMGGTADGVIKTQANGDGRASFGYSAGIGTNNQYVAATVADSGVAALHGRMISRSGVVLLMGPGAGFAVVALAAVTAITADGFIVTWTTNNAETQLIHYMAIGGSGTQARVMDVPIITSGVTTGVGFVPNLIIDTNSITGGSFDVGQASYATRLGFGSPRFVVGADGQQQFDPGTLGYEQWTGSVIAAQGTAGAATRVLRNDRLLVAALAGLTTLSIDTTLTSIDSDGFTETTAIGVTANRGVLFLKVPGVAIGVVKKPTGAGPVFQSIGGLGFAPRGVLFSSVQAITGSVPTTNGAAWGISALAASGSAAATSFIPTAPGATAFNYLSKTGKAIVKVNNNTPVIDAEATGVLDADGFTLNWNANDAVDTEFGYVVIGEAYPAQSPPYGHLIEAELNGFLGGWTSIMADVVVSPEIHFEYGISGAGPTDLVGSTGQLSFSLNNSDENSASRLGYYTPDGMNVRPGFKRGIRIRYSYCVPGTNRHYVKFIGKLVGADPIAGIYGERKTSCAVVDWINEAAEAHPNVAAQLNKRADQVLASIVAAVPVQPSSASYDVGDSTFAYSLDNSRSESASAMSEMQRISQSEYGRTYLRGRRYLALVNSTGTQLRFEKRSARLVPNPIAAFYGSQNGFTASSNVKNRAKATAHPRQVDGVDTIVLYSKPSQSNPPVSPGATIKINDRYTDPANRANRVGGTDMRTPVITTDYLMNAVADGSGADLSASFTVVAVYGANQVEYTITNTGGTLGYITKLQARGRGIYDYAEMDAVEINQASINQEGDKLVTLDMPYQSDVAIAQAVARFVVDLWSTPGSSEVRLRFVPATIDEYELAMSLEPGDPVTLSEEVTGVNGVYYIQRVNVQVTEPGEGNTSFEWLAQRALVQSYWTLGVAGLGELGLTTILAPL